MMKLIRRLSILIVTGISVVSFGLAAERVIAEEQTSDTTQVISDSSQDQALETSENSTNTASSKPMPSSPKPVASSSPDKKPPSSSPRDFKPSEQILEDYSVPFPVNI